MPSETTANAIAYSLIPIVLSALAIAISLITFYVNHVRVRKSEQIRICRDIFDKIRLNREGLLEITKTAKRRYART